MEMTPEEKALFNRRADYEAWCWALDMLRPLVEAVREIGCPELTSVMEKALADAEENVKHAQDALERERRK